MARNPPARPDDPPAPAPLTTRARRSALAVLASSSGVSSERAAFMQLVRAEIERVNKQLGKRGSVSMVYHRGAWLVGGGAPPPPPPPAAPRPRRLQRGAPPCRSSGRPSWRRWWAKSGWRTA